MEICVCMRCLISEQNEIIPETEETEINFINFNFDLIFFQIDYLSSCCTGLVSVQTAWKSHKVNGYYREEGRSLCRPKQCHP